MSCPFGKISPPSNQLLLSPHNSDSSSGSPQCTPMTPYLSFSVVTANYEPQLSLFPYSPNNQQYFVNNSASNNIITRCVSPPYIISKNRGSISLQLLYDSTSQSLQVFNF